MCGVSSSDSLPLNESESNGFQRSSKTWNLLFQLLAMVSCLKWFETMFYDGIDFNLIILDNRLH